MSVKELLEAVGRMREEGSPRGVYRKRIDGDAYFIAAALTNPAPITREELEKAGGDPIPGGFTFGPRLSCYRPVEEAGRWLFFIDDSSKYPVRPQPEAVCDLYALLLRLTRD